MNSFINHNKQFLSLLLGLLLSNSLHALTFRNRPLSDFVQPGQVLSIAFPENSVVQLKMEKNNFDVNGGDIKSLNNLKKVFEQVVADRGGSWQSRVVSLSGNILNQESSYFEGQENMHFQGKTALNFTRCLLKSPLISLASNEINFNDSFLIDPEVLDIVVDHPGSGYDIIRILFHGQPENPTVITGNIDFKDNQTAQSLLIGNVKKIIVQFVEDKNLFENSN